MKTPQLLFAIMFCVFIQNNHVNAQIPAIDSLEIIPVNPTSNDVVKIISHSIFPSGGCPLTNSNISINDSTIIINVAHTLGLMAVICYSTDTLSIGRLNAKTYNLIYNLALTTPPLTFDIDTLQFTIQQSPGLQFSDKLSEKIEIYPNPFANELNIVLKDQSSVSYSIDIYSILGQKMKAFSEIKESITADLSDLRNGIYFVQITNNRHEKRLMKIIKNAY